MSWAEQSRLETGLEQLWEAPWLWIAIGVLETDLSACHILLKEDIAVRGEAPQCSFRLLLRQEVCLTNK